MIPFRAGDDVRQVVVAVAGEHVAQSSEGADHLVRDEQDAVAIADLPHLLEVAGRRREAAAGVLHRLEDDRGDGLGALLENDPLDVRRAELGQGLALGLGPIRRRYVARGTLPA